MSANLLLVDADPVERRAVAHRLRALGHRVREADGVAVARQFLRTELFQVVLVDDRLADGTAFDVMAEIEDRQPGVPTLLLTSHETGTHAAESIRRGAFGSAHKHVDPQALEAEVGKALETADLRHENRRLRRLGEPGQGAAAFLGDSDVVRALREQIRRIARSPARAVLIEGESGTGKGLVARAIHDESPRAARPFVSLTCSAMPELLLESEMFGHEQGAFTDARHRKMGLLEAAEGGTLFLDEIGDMSPALQAKILGMLEERRFRRVGGIHEIDADVRIISATHRDLRALVQEGRFREDLLYRLRVVPLRIPPLRERREDVPALVSHFAAQVAADWGHPPLPVTAAALEVLKERSWPGNVRELRNAVERAVILARGEAIGPAEFGEEPGSGAGAGSTPAAGPRLPADGLDVEAWIDGLVREALERTRGNQSAAARLLRMSRDQVRYRMQHLGLLREREPRPSASEVRPA